MAGRVLTLAESPDVGMRVHEALSMSGLECQWCRELREALAVVGRWDPEALLVEPQIAAAVETAGNGTSPPRALVPVVIAGEAMRAWFRLGGGEEGLVAQLLDPRRSPDPAPPDAIDETFQSGGLRVDLAAHRAWTGREETHLTALEFRLLEFFIGGRGRLLTREEILHAVWGPEFRDDWSVLREAVKSLRRKLGEPGTGENHVPFHITTIRGEGYRFE